MNGRERMDTRVFRGRMIRRAGAGFTLIELMIVVAVVAILAAIAVPSYQEQVRKSRRAQAKADIVEYVQMAERFFTVNNTFRLRPARHRVPARGGRHGALQPGSQHPDRDPVRADRHRDRSAGQRPLRQPVGQ